MLVGSGILGPHGAEPVIGGISDKERSPPNPPVTAVFWPFASIVEIREFRECHPKYHERSAPQKNCARKIELLLGGMSQRFHRQLEPKRIDHAEQR